VRLEKARDDLATARHDLRDSRWRGAVNRAYYAIFHTASATLLWFDIERKKHSAVQAGFNQFLVKPGLIEVEYGQIHRKAREWREEQDYLDITRPLDEAVATQIVHDAERFVARLERYLREVGAID
jgi:uncharacterized protein (UPF0332 family)